MHETRVKAYRVDTEVGVRAKAADEADANAHGWFVVGREFGPDGALLVTYRHGYAPPPRSEWEHGPRPRPVGDPALPGTALIVGGAMAVAGSFLPWVTSTTFAASVSVSGVATMDGWVSALLGVALAAGGLWLLRGGSLRWPALLALSAATAGLGVVEVRHFQGLIDANASDAEFAQVGIGLWLVVGGGALGALGTILLRRAARP